jgi:predicted Zn finger-like uncharacterized protein
MIVVCSGCAAKFKVADEKVGPKGAKLRCSKCGTVFMVRRDEPVGAPPGSAPAAAPAPAPEPFVETPPAPPLSPPPLPRRTSTAASIGGLEAPPRSTELGAPVDARSAFEIDLEPSAPRGLPGPDPFAPALPDDPFATAAAPEPPPEPEPAPEAPHLPAPLDPFGLGDASPDPFAAVQAPVPPELMATAAASPGPSDDPFAAALPPLEGGQSPGGDLALEERTTPRPRAARPQSSAPMDDPFGAPVEGGDLSFDGGQPGDIPPMSTDLPGEPFAGFAPVVPGAEPQRAAPAPRLEAPLHVDPFAAAAVDADPLRVAGAPGPGGSGAAPGPSVAAEAALDGTAPRRLARLRSAAVNAVSLVAVLAAALALLLVWRGDVPLSVAVHPSQLLAALARSDRPAEPLTTRHVSSGFYPRARGAPLLFVRGEVVSGAPAAVPGVRVAVELVQAGAVVARGEAAAGAVLDPETLHGAVDAAALAMAAGDAALGAPAALQPGQVVPFLVALVDYPADLSGVSLRIRVEGERAR